MRWGRASSWAQQIGPCVPVVALFGCALMSQALHRYFDHFRITIDNLTDEIMWNFIRSLFRAEEKEQRTVTTELTDLDRRFWEGFVRRSVLLYDPSALQVVFDVDLWNAGNGSLYAKEYCAANPPHNKPLAREIVLAHFVVNHSFSWRRLIAFYRSPNMNHFADHIAKMRADRKQHRYFVDAVNLPQLVLRDAVGCIDEFVSKNLHRVMRNNESIASSHNHQACSIHPQSASQVAYCNRIDSLRNRVIWVLQSKSIADSEVTCVMLLKDVFHMLTFGHLPKSQSEMCAWSRLFQMCCVLFTIQYGYSMVEWLKKLQGHY
jgi:hypothetical protein